MRRDASFLTGEAYYIRSKSLGKSDIFLDEKDCERMMLLLYLCNTSAPVSLRDHLARGLTYPELWQLPREGPLVEVGAWCFMPDGLHLILREARSGGISAYMLKCTTAYSMYFNRKAQREGPLLRGPYLSEHVSSARYLRYLFALVHLYHVGLIPGEEAWQKEGIKNFLRASSFLQKYPYSSLPDYMDKDARPQSKILAPGAFSWKYISLETHALEVLDWQSADMEG